MITIAGTNGKGSTAKTLESIYFQAGFKTALYTSPHLMHFNERIRIHNKNIDDKNLLRAFSVIEKARAEIILSFFEFITLAALFLFQEAGCDVIILEAGLGGRLDAVNIVDSDVAAVTSVGFDHVDLLGHSLELIAYEKACIARANKPFICGEENPPKQIAETIHAKKATLYQIHQEFCYHVFDSHMSCVGKNFCYDQLPLPHLKPQNIAIAIRVIEALQKKLPVSKKNIIHGIQKTQWPGRFEWVKSPIPCILDVAHNPQAAQWLAKQYQQLPRVKNTIAIVGMLKDKMMIETVSALLPVVNRWYVCNLVPAQEERGSDGSIIVDFLKQEGKNCYTFKSIADAMRALAKAHCQQQCDRALIFGSFYTVAAAKMWLAKK